MTATSTDALSPEGWFIPGQNRTWILYGPERANRELRPPESRAMLADIEVRIVSLQILSSARVAYQIVWVLDNERHLEWVEDWELTDVEDGT